MWILSICTALQALNKCKHTWEVVHQVRSAENSPVYFAVAPRTWDFLPRQWWWFWYQIYTLFRQLLPFSFYCFFACISRSSTLKSLRLKNMPIEPHTMSANAYVTRIRIATSKIAEIGRYGANNQVRVISRIPIPAGKKTINKPLLPEIAHTQKQYINVICW